MSGNNHTPTPWIATDDYESNGIGIAQVGSFWIETESETEATASEKDDAAHIVKCVNCHDDLLSALKDAASVLSGENMSKSCLIRALEKAGQAIRKAEDSQ